MVLVVVRHGAEPALLQRQARLGAIESLRDVVGLYVDPPATPSCYEVIAADGQIVGRIALFQHSPRPSTTLGMDNRFCPQ